MAILAARSSICWVLRQRPHDLFVPALLKHKMLGLKVA